MPVLGIDTSCYTTSLAIVDGVELIADSRKLLAVPQGDRGLQQSQAFFQHIHNLDALISSLDPALRKNIDAVCVSARPRPVEGSYMPVFMAGTSVGHAIAAMLGARQYETSHQEGHIAAGFFSAGKWPDQPFLAFHISGGTTELLKVVPNDTSFAVDLLGGTTDLHAGQFVDRVGVALGLAFPAGPALEKLAQAGFMALQNNRPLLKPHVDGLDCSLSGAESAAQRMIQSGASADLVAAETLRCLSATFIKMANAAITSTGLMQIMVIGGVASNAYIRREMLDSIHADVQFAVNPFSSDNAVGVAAIGQQFLHRGGTHERTDS